MLEPPLSSPWISKAARRPAVLEGKMCPKCCRRPTCKGVYGHDQAESFVSEALQKVCPQVCPTAMPDQVESQCDAGIMCLASETVRITCRHVATAEILISPSPTVFSPHLR